MDVPIEQIEETFGREYSAGPDWNNADFDGEVDQEMSDD